MKNLFYTGCCFCGYALFQLLGFVAAAFPGSRTGAISLIFLLLLLIAAVGLTNWVGLYYKQHRITRTQTLVGFAPALVFGAIALFAVLVGVMIA